MKKLLLLLSLTAFFLAGGVSVTNNNTNTTSISISIGTTASAQVRSGNSTNSATVNYTKNRVYAIWNQGGDKNPAITLSNGNLTATATNASTQNVRSTIGKSTGQHYFEITITSAISNSTSYGVQTMAESLSALCGATAAGYGYNDIGDKKHSGVDAAYGTAPANGDVIGVLLDMTNGEISFRLNNTSFGVAYTGLSGTFYAGFSSGFGANSVTANFGATSFVYSVPSGYNAGLYYDE